VVVVGGCSLHLLLASGAVVTHVTLSSQYQPRLTTPTMGIRGVWQRSQAWFKQRKSVALAEQERLNAVSRNVKEGRIASNESAAIDALVGRGSSGYGEITPKGFRQLATRLAIGPSDHFADLGSGVGKAVVQAVAEFDVLSSYGIEISTTRHGLAVSALDGLDAAVGNRISYSRADCGEALE